MSNTDLQLLARYARDRAEDAFADVVGRHLNLVYSAALRQVRSPQLAEEVAQSVFTDLARAAHRLAPDTVLTAWLYQVTRRTAVDAVRREVRRQLREQIATEMNATHATASEWTLIESFLDDAMSALGETDRTAVLLRYFENKSLREVGQMLGTTDDAAQKRIRRAVERLRELLAKRGIAVGAGGLVAVLSTNAVQAAPAGLVVTISSALAGTTAAATATATVTKVIAMTTLQKSLVTATVAILAGVGFYEARQAAHLRDQVRTLQQQQAPLTGQIQQLKRERGDATNQLAELRIKNDGLNRNTAELLKLRGEVAVLRQQMSQLDHSSTPLPLDVPEEERVPMMAFGSELRDLGATTPERAATSLIWAARAGEQKRLSELLELPRNVPEQVAPRHYEFFSNQLSNVFSGMEFVAVESINPNPDGTLRLNQLYRDATTGRTNHFPFMLRLHESGWRVIVEGEVPN